MKPLAKLSIREVFLTSTDTILGCYVEDGVVWIGDEGKLNRVHKINTITSGAIVSSDVFKIKSLRRFKEDINSIGKGFECGVGISGHHGIKEGDFIEIFERPGTENVVFVKAAEVNHFEK